ncbi:MAG TPA: molybdopterin cofactor-binding domain-containing protein [Thermoanaerobaculia bacterium]
MSVITRITRRDFLRHAGVGTGALVFGSYISSTGLLAGYLFPITAPLDADPQGHPHFVAIEPLHGTIIIMSHRSEMGQGIRSSLAAVLADELEADWSRVVVRQADADALRYAVPNPYLAQHPESLPKYPVPEEFSQFVDSSRSMALYYSAMRGIGAGIRLVLVRAAAKKWGVDPAECEAVQHKVRHKASGRSFDYGNLLLLAEAKKFAKNPPTFDEVTKALKPSKEWRFINKEIAPSAAFVDVKDMATGKAVYGADVVLPGMMTAMIVRCPVANGQVKSFDDRAALAVPGVKWVERVLPDGFPMVGGVGSGFIPHAGVAVVAENTWAALQGYRALRDKVEWDLEWDPIAAGNAKYDSVKFRDELMTSTGEKGNQCRNKGDVYAAFELHPGIVERSYYVPHLAQTPMEPPVAVARYENGRWEVWAPTQGPEVMQHYVGLAMLRPKAAQLPEWLLWQVNAHDESNFECAPFLWKAQQRFNEELGKALGGLDLPALIKRRDALKEEVRAKVCVHPTLLGGGFGRKSKPDYGLEAAFLATKHPGVPIRVQWTREDDIHFSYHNAASVQHFKAAQDGAGKTTALLQRSAFTSFFATLFPSAPELFAASRAATLNGGEYPFGSGIERGHGLEDNPFELDNLRIENCKAENHVRTGWMRSVANIYHAFGICSFADELAVAAGRDSKDYLLELIGKGKVLDLPSEGVEFFDNNAFPMDACGTPYKVLPAYPADTRRLRRVIERVAMESGWDDKMKQYKGTGRGLGIAAHRCFLSYVATVIDVTLTDAKDSTGNAVKDSEGNAVKELAINEIYTAIDCGIAVNVDRVKAQMEGGVVYGLSLALRGEITLKKGAVEQNNFDDYPVLRLCQTPKIHPIIMPPRLDPDSPNPDPDNAIPTGVGEPPTAPVAPALANAIAAAGGPRIREVPFFRFVQVP